MAASGEPMSSILARLTGFRDRMQMLFMLDTLDYLARSGRVGPVTRLVGNLLDFKPLLTLRDGQIEFHGRVRHRAQALETLRDSVVSSVGGRPGARIGVMHAACAPDAQALADQLREALNPETILIGQVGAGVGANSGPGAIGVCWYAQMV
jgi:DegV family protein with EDD domain